MCVLACWRCYMAENCKIYTPDNWVGILLDEVGYISDLYGKRVLENSCGTGNVLRRVVERYIIDAIAQDYSLEQIKIGLEQDIFGLEIDAKACAICKRRLTFVAKKYGIVKVKWNIIVCDALDYIATDFSYVIGNPPYITYHDLSTTERDLLRKKYHTCKKGRFDYCYAFIEQSIKSLQENGKLAYIVPNSILKNVWAEELRTFLQPYLRKIIDLKNKNVFEDVTLSPVILIAEKDRHGRSEIVYQCDDDQIKMSLSNTDITSEAWALGNYKVASNKHKFGDYFEVSNSIATLFNDAFLISQYIDYNADHISVNGNLIERAVLRPAISIKTLANEPQPLIIFPYIRNENGSIGHYNEDEFIRRFPGAVAHLMNYRNQLDARKSDKTAKWFEYGRSQAINRLNCPKIVISVMVSGSIRVAIADETTIPFAGLYITQAANLSLDKAAEILQQEDFKLYVKQHGVPTANNSYRISKKILDAYAFDL